MNSEDTGSLQRRNYLPPISGGPSRNPTDETGFAQTSYQATRYDFNTGYRDQLEKEDLLTKGDAKPEVHFIGQILGGDGFDSKDGLFCEMLLQVGETWSLLSPKKLYQTQTCYADVDEIFVWSHPVDLHLAAGDLSGWPKAIFVVWRLDSSNKIDTFSYGVMDLPRTKGYHKLSCSTWSPMGDLNSGSLSFFLQTFPRLKQRDLLAQSLDKREVLNTTSSGNVLVELEVITKNFKILGVSD